MNPTFVISRNGPMPITLINFWNDLWNSKLNFERVFTQDFEVYDINTIDKEVYLYISIK